MNSWQTQWCSPTCHTWCSSKGLIRWYNMYIDVCTCFLYCATMHAWLICLFFGYWNLKNVKINQQRRQKEDTKVQMCKLHLQTITYMCIHVVTLRSQVSVMQYIDSGSIYYVLFESVSLPLNKSTIEHCHGFVTVHAQ